MAANEKPERRRSVRALELTDALGVANLRVVERPDPTPGPGEVLVRVKAVSLNYRDLLMVEGAYGGNTPLPLTPISDGCAVVAAVGPGVTRFAPGDRVATMFFQGWISGPPTPATQVTALGMPIPGAGRELAVFSQEGLSKVPAFLTDQQVATLPCAALTAWRGLFEDADLQPGDTVVLQGTGGVSIFGLQFAHAAGMRTLITSSSDAKLERARALGADHTVNYKTTPEWWREVRDATNGVGCDFIMEVGGPGTINQSMRATRLGGHIAIIGVVAQPSGGGAGEPFNPAGLIGNSAKLQGLSVGSRDMFERMCKAIDLHKISPVVDKVFDFNEAQAAFNAMRAGEHFGKIVIDFNR